MMIKSEMTTRGEIEELSVSSKDDRKTDSRECDSERDVPSVGKVNKLRNRNEFA